MLGHGASTVCGDGFCLGECSELYAYGRQAFLCISDASVTSHYIFIAMCTSLYKYQTSIGFLKQCLHVYEHRVRKGKHHIVNSSFPSGGEDKGDCYLSSIYQHFFFL